MKNFSRSGWPICEVGPCISVRNCLDYINECRESQSKYGLQHSLAVGPGGIKTGESELITSRYAFILSVFLPVYVTSSFKSLDFPAVMDKPLNWKLYTIFLPWSYFCQCLITTIWNKARIAPLCPSNAILSQHRPREGTASQSLTDTIK